MKSIDKEQPDQIPKTEFFLRINTLESHALTAVTVEYPRPGLIMDVNDFRLADISDLIALFLCPVGPGKIFQRGDVFIIRMLLPQLPSNGRVGIVAERMVLTLYGMVREPLLENHMFGEFRGFHATLLSIRYGHLRFLKRVNQFCQPIRIYRINMRAGKHDKISIAAGNPLVQGITKGEILRFDVHHFHRKLTGNFHCGIG